MDVTQQSDDTLSWGSSRFSGHIRDSLALALGLLLIVIILEMALPQVLGRAITICARTSVRVHRSNRCTTPRCFWHRFFLRKHYCLQPWANPQPALQKTLQDIRSAIYNAMQRLSFSYHDKATPVN
jgi:hypothetical protein